MWVKFASAFVCWFAALGGVIKLIHAVPLRPGGGYFYHESVAMILVGGSFLLLAMTIKKFQFLFSIIERQKNRKGTHGRIFVRIASSSQSGNR
jgi:uncharacterized membrane protein YidH (DUF202 family)